VPSSADQSPSSYCFYDIMADMPHRDRGGDPREAVGKICRVGRLVEMGAVGLCHFLDRTTTKQAASPLPWAANLVPTTKAMTLIY